MKQVSLWSHTIVITQKEDWSVKDHKNTYLQSFCFLQQVHSNTIIDSACLTKSWINEVKWDGIFASYDDPYNYGVYVWDCVPVILLGKEHYIILHAWWRGIYQWIIHNAVKKLYSHWTQDIDISVYLWPCICSSCFAFWKEALQYFPPAYIHRHDNDMLTVDLPWIIQSQCAFHGIKKEKIFMEQVCTHCSDEYFSARRWESWRIMVWLVPG